MNNAGETTSLGSRSRLDRETSNGHRVWRQLLLSVVSDYAKAIGDISENHGSEVSGCDENSVEEDEDNGYGSISRYKRRNKDKDGTLLDNASLAKSEPSQRSDHQNLYPLDDDTLPSRSVDLDETDYSVEQRLARLKHRRRSLIAWTVLVFLSCSCLTFFTTGMLQGPSRGKNNRNTGLSQIFFFDTLFSGVKKKPSKRELERPPPLARSILLVLRAEVTPENVAVKDMDRQLTAKGMRDAEGLGVYLMQHHIPAPDWIFVSPSERTAFTTELVRRHWASEAPVAFEDILYTLEFNDYFSFVAGLNDQFRRVMIVGHNPAILNTAKKLMKTHGIEDFPDCGFMEIRWNDLVHWGDVKPSSGSSTMALDPNNNFFFSSPR